MRLVPMAKRGASEARYQTAWEISSGSPTRPPQLISFRCRVFQFALPTIERRDINLVTDHNTDHNQDVVAAIAQAYHVERTLVDAAIDKAVAGQVNALLCVGINLSPEQLPPDPEARREFIECKIGEHLNER